MSRAPVLVRDAAEGDASALDVLWADLQPSPATDRGDGSTEGLVAAALRRHAADGTARVVVAEIAGGVVGCAFFRTALVSPLHTDRVVQVSHVNLDPAQTRQGVARALLEAAVSWAEQQGIATVVTATAPGDRDANRFLARLGVAPVAILRAATVSALRARLPHDPSVAARIGLRKGRSVSQVVAARRSQRRAQDRQPAG